MKKYLYIANWKMNMPLLSACSFYSDHQQELERIAALPHVELVLCPSYVALSPLHALREKNSHIYLGAQNCASHNQGAYTGEVDALSLAHVGCTYCIVGHSERRQLYGETDAVIAEKITLLGQYDITPILCIGETQEEAMSNRTHDILSVQLEPVLKMQSIQSIVIAYEPFWAIGTGKTPSFTELSILFNWLFEHACKHASWLNVRLVYGGSVNASTIQMLKPLPFIDGFLIGSASCDFSMLKNIVE
jgi:triosephosphate isomerase